MKKTSLLILIAIVLCSCDQIERQDLIGHWVTYQNSNFPEVTFSENKVKLADHYGFGEIGTYEIIHERLIIKTDNTGRVETDILNLSKDSILIFDSLTYYRYPADNDIEDDVYQLIDLDTNQKLNQRKAYNVIHLYKSEAGERRIRLGDKAADYQEIPYFLAGGHSNPEILMFIGAGVQLSDLKSIYYHFAADRQSRVTLVMKKNGIHGYEVFVDNVEVWWDELKDFLGDMKIPPPPPPPIAFRSREKYLGKGGELIEINNPEDFRALSELEEKKRYLISIDEGLGLEDYLYLKEKIYHLRKKGNFQIRTEVIRKKPE